MTATEKILPADGVRRPITRWGEPVMHKSTRQITEFDDGLARLVADMVATMDAADGVGLAAPQVGVDLAVFVYRCPDADDVEHAGVICNPRLTIPSNARRTSSGDDELEGCLSLPGAYAPLVRADRARVEGVDAAGQPVTVDGTGLLARCLQHETDHLLGTVFGDLLKPRARRRLLREAEEHSEDFGPDWPAG